MTSSYYCLHLLLFVCACPFLVSTTMLSPTSQSSEELKMEQEDPSSWKYTQNSDVLKHTQDEEPAIKNKTNPHVVTPESYPDDHEARSEPTTGQVAQKSISRQRRHTQRILRRKRLQSPKRSLRMSSSPFAGAREALQRTQNLLRLSSMARNRGGVTAYPWMVVPNTKSLRPKIVRKVKKDIRQNQRQDESTQNTKTTSGQQQGPWWKPAEETLSGDRTGSKSSSWRNARTLSKQSTAYRGQELPIESPFPKFNTTTVELQTRDSEVGDATSSTGIKLAINSQTGNVKKEAKTDNKSDIKINITQAPIRTSQTAEVQSPLHPKIEMNETKLKPHQKQQLKKAYNSPKVVADKQQDSIQPQLHSPLPQQQLQQQQHERRQQQQEELSKITLLGSPQIYSPPRSQRPAAQEPNDPDSDGLWWTSNKKFHWQKDPTPTHKAKNGSVVHRRVSRPSTPNYSQKSVLQECDRRSCRPPDCMCASYTHPGRFPVSKVPMMVMLTFDDTVHSENFHYFQQIMDKDFRNPNGCPMKMTFFVCDDNSNDYDLTRRLYRAGHEIASHSQTHQYPESWWSQEADQYDYQREFVGQRENLVRESGIPETEIRGLRAPFLSINGDNMLQMARDFNFDYDTSCVSSQSIGYGLSPMWPYTLDYPPNRAMCEQETRPTESFPGVWEVPLTKYTCDDRDPSSSGNYMLDECAGRMGNNATDVLNFLWRHFNHHYQTRAPMGVFTHATFFRNQPEALPGVIAFLDGLTKMKDVWLVSVSQMLDWMKSPTPVSRIPSSLRSWTCSKRKHGNRNRHY